MIQDFDSCIIDVISDHITQETEVRFCAFLILCCFNTFLFHAVNFYRGSELPKGSIC